MMKKAVLNRILGKFGFEVHGTGFLQAMRKQDFQRDAFLVQKEILKNARVILDIGANRGTTVEKYSNMYPNASIFAFEPYPSSFNILKERTEKNKNISCIQAAVTERRGTEKLNVNKNVDTNSLLSSHKSGLSSDIQVKTSSSILVESISIDEFCSEQHIEQIDILKLDIQGGELGALKGAQGMLAQKKIKLIYTEAYFVMQYINQPLFYDISLFLHNIGYQLQDIYNPIYGDGKIAWCDSIFLQKGN